MHSRRRFLSRAAALAASAALPGYLLADLGDKPRRVILDVDLGIDDAFALMFAHYLPTIDLVGITTAFGNTTLEKATRNSLYIKEKFGIEADVYAGAAAALYDNNWTEPTFVHGEDGLGDIEKTLETNLRAATMSAPEFIARTITENPGEITVIAVGPFTNLAIARLLDPSIVDNVREVIIMGGAAGLEGILGNATTVGEANVINDPHAADAIFRYDWPLTMVGLDVTYTDSGATDPVFLDRLANRAGEAGRFLERINRYYMKFYESARGVRKSFQHDSIAVALAVAPELFETKPGKLRVVTEGFARGQTVFCPTGHHTSEAPEWIDRPTHTICSKLDGAGFLELFERTIVEGYAAARQS